MGSTPGGEAKREAILAYIRRHYDEHGFAPSIREIQIACGISSTSVVDYNLRVLEAANAIRREPGIGRSITLMAGRDGREALRALSALRARFEAAEHAVIPGRIVLDVIDRVAADLYGGWPEED